MKKETFIEAIEAIQKQIKYDIEIGEKLGKAYPNAFSANLIPDNHFLGDSLLKILQEEMNDTEKCEYNQSWIEWFCFETNFGEESYRLTAQYKNGDKIKMSTAAELYDFLNKR
jgi:hypothetical protein